MSIGDIRKTKEGGTLSQNLTEWSNPIQVCTQEKGFHEELTSFNGEGSGQAEKFWKNELLKQIKAWVEPETFFLFSKWAFEMDRALSLAMVFI